MAFRQNVTNNNKGASHQNNKTTMGSKIFKNNKIKGLMLVVVIFMGWHTFPYKAPPKPVPLGNQESGTSMRTAPASTTKNDSSHDEPHKPAALGSQETPTSMRTAASTTKNESSSDEPHKPTTLGNRETAKSMRTEPATTTIDSSYDATILGPLAQNALNILQERHNVYKKAGVEKNWHLRGIAHLYMHRNVLLVGRHIITVDENDNGNHDKKRQQHSIRIDNVYNLMQDHSITNMSHTQPTTSSKTKPPSCIRLALWVRVAGPEIFAGKALSVGNDDDNHCYWKFDFDPVVPGEYKIDAKVLMWDSVTRKDFFNRELHLGEGDEPPKDILEKYPTHGGFQGFKFYQPPRMCSTACSRQLDPPCRYWRTPPYKIENPSRPTNGCEFFFDANATVPFASWLLKDLTNVTIPSKRKVYIEQPKKQHRRGQQHRRRLGGHKPTHGFPLPEVVAYYLGCGWSTMFTLDFPCLSGMLDDQVYVENVRIQITPQVAAATSVSRISNSNSSQSAQASSTTLTQQQRPLCSLGHETITSFPSPQVNNNTALPATGRWVTETWPNGTQCPVPLQYEKEEWSYFDITKHDGDHPHCYHRDNLHRIGWACVEMNCRLIKEVSIHRDVEFRDTHWMGTWKPYECDLLEYTNSELQQCVDKLKISQFAVKGKSIAGQYDLYLKQRTRDLKLHQGSGGRNAILSTNGLLHSLTFTLPEFLESLQKMPNMTDEEGSEITILASAYFLSSVREIPDWESMAYANKLVREHLIPKGYKYINAFDMSAAMTFDTAQQMDGMHLLGPVPKMVITKFFHHLCKDVVEGGTRL